MTYDPFYKELLGRGVQKDDGHVYQVPAKDLVEYQEAIRTLIEERDNQERLRHDAEKLAWGEIRQAQSARDSERALYLRVSTELEERALAAEAALDDSWNDGAITAHNAPVSDRLVDTLARNPHQDANSQAPSEALAEFAAKIWWEGVQHQWKHRPVGNRVVESENPYRKTI